MRWLESMTDQQINLKNPVIAGVLAYLLPGAGHLYQGRMFKAAVYAICILGLFFSGMAMADWKAVQPPAKGSGKKIEMLKYAAQLGVGLPSMYGLVQRERYGPEGSRPTSPALEAFSAPFEGQINLRGDSPLTEEIQGTVHLEPETDRFGDTTYAGRLETVIDGKELEFHLGSHIHLGREVKASENRVLEAPILGDQATPFQSIGEIRGSIPRPFLNWYQVPMDDEEVQELHGKLGKYHELAMVFTWVAGLLNVLAIWDAVEGPAYGYGGSESDTEDENSTNETDAE